MFGSGFYNPYLYQPYYQAANVASNLGSATGAEILGKSGGLAGFKGLLSKFSFSGFLNSASKTLNVVNQAIPIYYQVRPMINNAKTMFKIASEFGKSNTNNTETSSNEVQNYETNETENISYNNEGPNFFI